MSQGPVRHGEVALVIHCAAERNQDANGTKPYGGIGTLVGLGHFPVTLLHGKVWNYILGLSNLVGNFDDH